MMTGEDLITFYRRVEKSERVSSELRASYKGFGIG
jgi:hypothetical protein